MSDLMNCQLCGSEPWPRYLIDNDSYVVGCYSPRCCMMSITIKNISTISTEDSATNCKIADKNWNDLQRLIARGQLLDDAPLAKGGRL